MTVLRVLMWLIATVYLITGKLLAFVMVPVGILTDWKYKLTWPWDALPNPQTGQYYDPWYDDLSSGNHSWYSRLLVKNDFLKEYYWRVRNGFSNGMRYAIPFTGRYTTIDYKYGFLQFDTDRPYLSRVRFKFPFIFDRYIEVYVGFKVDRSSGSGFTNRLPFRVRRNKR